MSYTIENKELSCCACHQSLVAKGFSNGEQIHIMVSNENSVALVSTLHGKTLASSERVPNGERYGLTLTEFENLKTTW